VSGRIVVGVDGSAASKRALSWAFDEARLRGTSLAAIHAWTRPIPSAAGFPGGLVVPIDESTVEALQESAQEVLQRVVSEVQTEGVEVEQRVVEGSAAGALIEAADGAELLVVGSRGHGGFAGLLLGSVSQQCAHYANCPVVIIRAPEAGDHETRSR
jgi:nucleotide-binding universal stress UspA family protein